jgi:hypothetical protein
MLYCITSHQARSGVMVPRSVSCLVNFVFWLNGCAQAEGMMKIEQGIINNE